MLTGKFFLLQLTAWITTFRIPPREEKERIVREKKTALIFHVKYLSAVEGVGFQSWPWTRWDEWTASVHLQNQLIVSSTFKCFHVRWWNRYITKSCHEDGNAWNERRQYFVSPDRKWASERKRVVSYSYAQGQGRHWRQKGRRREGRHILPQLHHCQASWPHGGSGSSANSSPSAAAAVSLWRKAFLLLLLTFCETYRPSSFSYTSSARSFS